jgi:VanZ family protein
VLGYAGLLFYLSSMSQLPTLAESANDKVLHALAYGVLALLAVRAFHGDRPWLRARPALGAVAFTVAYGASDEIHQIFVPGRSPDLVDLLADAAGAVVAVGLIAVVLRYHREGRE